MGINGLWQILEPAAQTCTINDIGPMNGLSEANKSDVPRIGVDLSVIINECVAVERGDHIYEYKTGKVLLTFFYKLCIFLREAPCIMIFVSDGPNRPSFKRSKDIDTHTTPDWSTQCKTIIEAFGFYWHQASAPGEADAELANLNRCGVIDMVITSDGDALVFGALRILKRVSGSDKYLFYSMDKIENTVGLSRGGLLLVALLSKSDYSDGLASCGASISASLARCGFGDRLLHAAERLEDFKLCRELDCIAEGIRAELLSNSRGFLHSRYPRLASNFNVDIISPDKIATFLDPIVTRSTAPSSPTRLPSSFPTWINKEPSIPQIGRFCMCTFGWPQNLLEKKLENVLWPGIFLRILTSPLLFYDHAQKLCRTPSTKTEILKVKKITDSRTNRAGRWGRVEYSTDNFVALLGIGSDGAIRPKKTDWLYAAYLPKELDVRPIDNVDDLSPIPPQASTSVISIASEIDFTYSGEPRQPTVIGEAYFDWSFEIPSNGPSEPERSDYSLLGRVPTWSVGIR